MESCICFQRVVKSAEIDLRLSHYLYQSLCRSENCECSFCESHLFVIFIPRFQVSSTSECKKRTFSLTPCVGFHTRPCLWPRLSAQEMKYPCSSGEKRPRTMVSLSQFSSVVNMCAEASQRVSSGGGVSTNRISRPDHLGEGPKTITFIYIARFQQ